MDNGVAVLGSYEEEPFDQHSHLQAQIDAGLTDSVSFGRFANDNISWVKRSSFNHNQYLEELGNCSAPGSVRQKKAYFEAYYKAKREREALEKALAEANCEAQTNEESGVHCDNGQSFDEVINPESTQNAMCYDTHETIDEGIEENSETLVHQVAVGSGSDEIAEMQPLQEDAEPVSSVDNGDGHSHEYQDIDESQNSSKDHSCNTDLVSDENQNGVVIDSAADNLHEPNTQYEIVTKEILHDTIYDSITSEDKVDDKRDDEMVDKFETSKTQQESVQKYSTHTVVAGNYGKVPKTATKKPAQSTNLKTSYMGSVVSSTASKVGKSKDSRKQGPAGVAELKSQHHTNVTVPQPFALATNKRAAGTGVIPVADGIRSSGKPLRNGSLVHSSPLKKPEAPVKNTKLVPERKPTPGLENRMQKEKPQPRSKTPTDVTRQIIPSTKTLKQENKDINGTLTAAPNETRLTNSAKSRPSPVKSRNITFSFKSDERAEKRKEFYTKLEAKLNAKEAEKNQAEAKTQEEAEEKLRQLRKSLNFKATPMPTFYQDNVQSKLESKKNVIPTTRAKSPKLGRKNAPDVNLKKESLTDLRPSKIATSVQKKPSKTVEHSERPKESTSGSEDVSLNNPPGEAVQCVEPNTSGAVQDINTNPVEPHLIIVNESKSPEYDVLQKNSPEYDGGNPSSFSLDEEHVQESKVSLGPKKRAETPVRSQTKRADTSCATTPGRRNEGKPGTTSRIKSDGQNATPTTRGERTPVRDRLKTGLSSGTPGNKIGKSSSSKSTQKPVKKDAPEADVVGTVKEEIQA